MLAVDGYQHFWAPWLGMSLTRLPCFVDPVRAGHRDAPYFISPFATSQALAYR